MQEEAGGKKREERVDWMYAAPAEGNGPSAEELEQYLLGKKRVDKLLKDNQEQVRYRPLPPTLTLTDTDELSTYRPSLKAAPSKPPAPSPPFKTPTPPATPPPRSAKTLSSPSSVKSKLSTRRC